MQQIHLIISGRVQNVGYRAWTVSQAKKLGLTGWVKNRDDGSVELVAEGEKNKLYQFIKMCQTGPFASEVKDIQAEIGDAKGETDDFKVIY